MNAGFLPESFTICSAIKVDAWNGDGSASDVFTLIDVDGDRWGYMHLYAANRYILYKVDIGPTGPIETYVESDFFPLQWTRICFSLDSIASNLRLRSATESLFP